MNNLEEFLNNKLSEEGEDEIMEKITRRRMDGIRSSYEQKLAQSHGVSKENPPANNVKGRIIKMLLMASSVAALYLILSTAGIFGGQQDFSNDIAAYIDKNKVYNYDIIRGGAHDEAYNEYQLGNYSNAINIWKNVEMNLQDSFYLSMSYLYSGLHKEAAANFDALNPKLASGDKFYPEQQLYWALTLVLMGDEDGATKMYESWPENSWMAGEYGKIMKLGK